MHSRNVVQKPGGIGCSLRREGVQTQRECAREGTLMIALLLDHYGIQDAYRVRLLGAARQCENGRHRGSEAGSQSERNTIHKKGPVPLRGTDPINHKRPMLPAELRRQ